MNKIMLVKIEHKESPGKFNRLQGFFVVLFNKY